MKSKSGLIIILLFIMLAVPGYSMEKRQLDDNSSFKLIIWGYSVKDIKDIETLTYRQLISKHVPGGMLSDKYIVRYYWDEQLIEYEYDRIKEETGQYFPMSNRFFSIVLDNEIVLHGISRTMARLAIKLKYDDSNYPAIVNERCSNPGNWILALKPKYEPIDSLFRDYDEEEQKRILHQEVLEHFEKEGKVVRGKMDLNKLFYGVP